MSPTRGIVRLRPWPESVYLAQHGFEKSSPPSARGQRHVNVRQGRVRAVAAMSSRFLDLCAQSARRKNRGRAKGDGARLAVAAR